MKNLIIISLCLLGIAACRQPTDTSAAASGSIDKAKIEQEVGAVMNQYFEAAKGNKDLMQSIMADDAQLFGSDPTEKNMDKAGLISMLEAYQQDSLMAAYMGTLSYEVTERLIKVSDDGNQAVVTDQSIVSFCKLPLRTTAIFERQGDAWKMVYGNSAFLVKNEDMARVDALFE